MKFKICLIGCGHHARLAHGPSLQKYARQNADVVLGGACDLHLPTAQAFATDFGFSRAYTDWTTMLDQEKPDAVSVVLPTHLTAITCLPLLERGLPLLIEKPPAMTSAELAAMSAVAERDAVPTLVAFNRRYTTLMCQARKLLDDNIPLESVFQIDYDMIRHDRHDSDFSVTAVHALDALLYLARSPLRQARFRYREVAVGDSEVTNILMDGACESGADVRLNVQPVAGVVLERANIHARRQTLTLEISLRGDCQEGNLRYWRDDKLEFETATGSNGLTHAASFEQNGFYAENEAFFNAVRNREQPEIRVQDCAQQIMLMEAIRTRASSVAMDIPISSRPASLVDKHPRYSVLAKNEDSARPVELTPG